MAATMESLLCGLCEADSKCRYAVGYCQFCQHYLCQTCYDYHQNLGKIHKLLDKKNMPRERVSLETPPVDKCTEKCPQHKSKVLELYCKNHDEACCIICVTSCHKTCDYVYVPDHTPTLTKNPKIDCETVIKHLQVLMRHFEDVKSESNRNIKELEKQKREFGCDVRKFRKEIDAVLDQLEKQVMSEMRQAYDKELKQLTENCAKCDEAILQLEESYKNAQVTMETGGPNRIFTVLKVSQKTHHDNTAELKTIKEKSYNMNLEFEEHFPILKTLRSTKAFGKVILQKELVRFNAAPSRANLKTSQSGKKVSVKTN